MRESGPRIQNASLATVPVPNLGGLKAFHSRNQTGPAAGLRVALFSGNYNVVRDGANNALNRLVAHLLDRGAAVRIYSPTVAEPAFVPNGDLISVPSLPIPGRREFRLAMGLSRSVRADLELFAPNIVHVSAPDPLGVAAQKFAHKRAIPVVASMHTRFETYFDYYGLGPVRDWAWRHLSRFYQRSDHVLVPNADCADSIASMGIARDRLSIWGRGVDRDVFTPERRNMSWRRAQGYRDSDTILLFFGRIVLEKGVDSFVQTIAELRARGYCGRPMIVGDGPALPWMREALGDALCLGHLEGEALGRAVASADIFINPSLTEAFGNVTLEAMAAGLAIVSADVGSARALIRAGHSGLLAPCDPTSLADAVERLFRDPALARQLRNTATGDAATFRWPAVLDAALAAYLAVRAKKICRLVVDRG